MRGGGLRHNQLRPSVRALLVIVNSNLGLHKEDPVVQCVVQKTDGQNREQGRTSVRLWVATDRVIQEGEEIRRRGGIIHLCNTG